MKKIIFSRKGFDDSYGCSTSPILPDDEMLSLPIPGNVQEKSNYLNVLSAQGRPLSDIMGDLDISPRVYKKPCKTNHCHLDPDLRESAKINRGDWAPAFGSGVAPTTHLLNTHKIQEGDLFLFYGSFRKTQPSTPLKWDSSHSEMHAIFGYLQIGAFYRTNGLSTLPSNIHYHPHASDSDGKNAIFVPRDSLTFNAELPGAGVFRYNDHLKLTKEGFTKSRWGLDPEIFGNTQISCHNIKKAWKTVNGKIYFQTNSPAQEYVVDINDNQKIIEWVKNLFDKALIVDK